jgi:hypothetical protein
MYSIYSSDMQLSLSRVQGPGQGQALPLPYYGRAC